MRNLILGVAVGIGVIGGIGLAQTGLAAFLFPKSVSHIQSVAAKRSLILAEYVVYHEVVEEERGADVLIRWNTTVNFMLDLKQQPLVFTEEVQLDGGVRLVVTAPPITFQSPPAWNTEKYRSINLNKSVLVDEDRIAKEFYETRILDESVKIAENLVDKPEVRNLVERELINFVKALTLGLGLEFSDIRVEFTGNAPEAQS